MIIVRGIGEGWRRDRRFFLRAFPALRGLLFRLFNPHFFSRRILH